MPPYNMQQPPLPTSDKKKRRISDMFGGKKESNTVLSPPIMDQTLNHQASTSTNGGIAADSAYASSDNPSSKRNSRSDIQPIENNGRIEGVSQDRSLDVNNRTGEVFDHDTGEVVSTVTTTTTTTTTTVHKGASAGKKGTTVQVETHRQQNDHQNDHLNDRFHPAEIAEAPGDRPRREESIRIAESQRQQTHTPSNQPTTWHDQHDVSPPARNPNRKSNEFGESPYKHNFSYPSRTELKPDENPVSPMTSQPPQSFGGSQSSPFGGNSSSRPKSTFDNLKSAAIGLHGVGETLRGTLNNEVDSRFPRHNNEKAAAATAKNQQTLERGNTELARLRSDRERYQQYSNTNSNSVSGAPQIPPLHPTERHDRVPSRSPRPTPRENYPVLSSYPPPPSGPPPMLPTYTPANSSFGPNSHPGLGTTTHIAGGAGGSSTEYTGGGGAGGGGDEMSHVPGTFMPESSGPVKKESRFGRLVKRRP